MSKKYFIKVPSYITTFYCFKKKIVVIQGPSLTKILRVSLHLFLNKNIIKVSSIPFSKTSNHGKKKIKVFQGLILASIKQIIMESSISLYYKLKFIGVGYRAFFVDSFKNQLLLIKVGYSHFIYFRNFDKIQLFCLKTTRLFLYGNCYQSLMQAGFSIRSYKKPEPYKGKGILYSTEKIFLKEGKKV